MKYCNEERIRRHYEEFWARENETPLLQVIAPKDGARWDKAPRAPERLADRWLDTEYVLKQNRCILENTAYVGEAFPMFFANFGPDILGAIFGCEIEFGQDTSWALHAADCIGELPPVRFDENNRWYRRMMERTEALLEDSRGEYAVGNNDFHTGLDALVSMIGPEQLCVDLLGEADAVKARLRECAQAYRQVYLRENALIRSKQGFSTNWMGHYGVQNWYVTSCDFSALISPEMFDEFALPYLAEELEMLEGSIYHLDGKDALRHLPRLLSLKKLDGIQWVYGAGAPSARHWIDVLKQIQAAGKCIEIAVEKDDVKPILESLKPQGLLLKAFTATESEAEELYRFVTGYKGGRE